MSGVIGPLVKFLRANAKNIREGHTEATANMLEAVASCFEKHGDTYWRSLAFLVNLNERMREAPFNPPEAKAK